MPEETKHEQSERRMGVYDFNSVLNLLLNTFEKLYPEQMKHHLDAQGMLKLIETEVLTWRRTGRGLTRVEADPVHPADPAGK
jgi:hypothetical protein